MKLKRRFVYSVFVALLITICLSGCSQNVYISVDTALTVIPDEITAVVSPETPTVETTTVPSATPTATPIVTPTVTPTATSTIAPTATPTLEPMPTDTPEPTLDSDDWRAGLTAFEPYETYETNVDGHHTWNPHIFGYFHEQYHGEEYKQSFFNMIDALIAGEDTFECASEDAFNWCIGGRFINLFFPLATDCISYFDGGYENGIGKLSLTVSKEVLAERIKEFEQMVIEILDDAVSDDYNDFETAISLFDYISRNWVYDYEEYENKDEKVDLTKTLSLDVSKREKAYAGR